MRSEETCTRTAAAIVLAGSGEYWSSTAKECAGAVLVCGKERRATFNVQIAAEHGVPEYMLCQASTHSRHPALVSKIKSAGTEYSRKF